MVTSAQLGRIEFTRSSISRWVAAGRLHPVVPRVYAVGHGALSQEARWMAAVLMAGENAALSRLSAALLWRIWRCEAKRSTSSPLAGAAHVPGCGFIKASASTPATSRSGGAFRSPPSRGQSST